MVVRDEEHIVERALRSALPHIDSWCIVDTGSTDSTKDIVERVMKGVPGELYEREWRDFAHNRMELFELARSHGDYILSVDADDIVGFDDDFSWGELGASGYHIRMAMSGVLWYRVNLLRLDQPWRYKHPIHAYPYLPNSGPLPKLKGLRITALTDGRRRIDNPVEKYERDCVRYKKLIQDDPVNSRHRFYYAQSLRDAGRREEAISAYLRRSVMGGYEEEVWYSMYQAGVLFHSLGRIQEAISAHMSAYELRFTRAEPLVALARIAREQKKYPTALLYARAARETNMPEEDMLFLEEDAYGWRALDEYAVAAYWLGLTEEAEAINSQIIDEVPPQHRVRIAKNLQYCRDELAKKRRSRDKG